jgi:hypothetical protein
MNVTLPGGHLNLQNECATAAMSIFALAMCSAEEGSGNRSAALLGQGSSPAADSWTVFE